MHIHLLVAAPVLAWAAHMAGLGLNLARLDDAPPPQLAGSVTPEAAAKHAAYARANTRLSMLQDSASLALLLGFLLLGGFGLLDQWARGLAGLIGLGGVVPGLLFLGLFALLADLASLPWDIYHTFVLENRYGFNTTTPGTFVADKLKGWLVLALLGGPLAAGVLGLFRALGPSAWVWCWGAAMAWLLLVTWLGPRVLLPLFNRFTPLGDGDLRAAIEDYARSQDLRLGGISVMDGSRRSTKANAFFTGIGPTKRIALFDTLLSKLSNDEVVAVLAHEAGHLKLKHIPKRLATATLKTGLIFWLLSLVLARPEFALALGGQPSVHLSLAAFGLLLGPVSLVLSLVENRVSRAHEFQADAFAARTFGHPEALASSLEKLASSNLSLLDPHPAYVWLNMGHPPLIARLDGLRRPLAGPPDGPLAGQERVGHTPDRSDQAS